MSLQERLMADLKDAMRANDGIRKDAIRMLRAAIKNAEIAAQRELDDEEIQQLVARDIKHREEAIEMLRQANRSELVDIEEASIRLLRAYLPAQLSREQIEQVVQDIISKLDSPSPAQLGIVMREAMSQLKGRADGRLVNEIVRRNLMN